VTLRSSARPQGIRTELVLVLLIAEGVFRELSMAMTILAIRNAGASAEIRVSDILPERRMALRSALDVATGPHYDVTLEPTHMLITYNPKDLF
jgi:hypothetical protein